MFTGFSVSAFSHLQAKAAVRTAHSKNRPTMLMCVLWMLAIAACCVGKYYTLLSFNYLFIQYLQLNIFPIIQKILNKVNSFFERNHYTVIEI